MVLELWLAGILVGGSAPVFGVFESEFECSKATAEGREAPPVIAVSDCARVELTFKFKEVHTGVPAPSAEATPDTSAPAAGGGGK